MSVGTLGAVALLPPFAAIACALITRRIASSLLAGVLAAEIVLNLHAPWLAPFRALADMIAVAGNRDNLSLIVFSLAVGALLKLIQDSGGFLAFAHWVERARGGYGRGTVFAVTFGLGAAVFLECWSNILVNGTTLRPLYDRIGVSRERMAYFVHTIGLNFVAMIVVNGWGAFYVSLLRAQKITDPFTLIVATLPFNFYGWSSLALVVVVMATGLTIGPMKAAEAAVPARLAAARPDAPGVAGVAPVNPARLAYMVAPLLTLVGVMVASLALTGGGDVTRGDGSASIVYAVCAAIAVAGALLLANRAIAPAALEEKILQGMAGFLTVSLIIVFALSLGQLCKTMGSGVYMAQLMRAAFPVALIPAVVFLLGGAMSFATGTSYGTLAILTPIAIPIGEATGLGAPLMFGACLSGAIFGDNTSPLNDNAMITSIAADVSVMDHVRTQLPYALIAGSVALAGFVIAGLMQA